MSIEQKAENIEVKNYPILDDKGKHIFSVKVFGNPEYRMKFEVWEKATIKNAVIVAGTARNSARHFLYAKGEIAWDGASHIIFAENGKLVLTGAKEWALHCSLMILIYKLASKLVLHYNPAFGGDFSKGIQSLKIMSAIEDDNEQDLATL